MIMDIIKTLIYFYGWKNVNKQFGTDSSSAHLGISKKQKLWDNLLYLLKLYFSLHSFVNINIVTYSGFSIHDGTLLHSKKSIHYSQTSSATLWTHVHVQPARSRNTHSYRILPTGPLVAIFQHSLPFLQS
jgi:hypothetical protein